jgi:hypothetical protein
LKHPANLYLTVVLNISYGLKTARHMFNTSGVAPDHEIVTKSVTDEGIAFVGLMERLQKKY